MIRAVILLLIVLALVAVVMSLVRRARRPREYQVFPTAAEAASAPPPSLAAPQPEQSDGPVLGVDEVLHKLNELAFSRTLTTSAGGHAEIITAVTESLDTAVNEPRYAPRRPMLLPQLMKA